MEHPHPLWVWAHRVDGSMQGGTQGTKSSPVPGIGIGIPIGIGIGIAHLQLWVGVWLKERVDTVCVLTVAVEKLLVGLGLKDRLMVTLWLARVGVLDGVRVGPL